MSDTVTLQNKSRTIQTFNLPYERKKVTTRLTVALEDGTVGTKDVDRHLAGSVTFLAGETLKDLPKEILDVKAIKTAMTQGVLRLIR